MEVNTLTPKQKAVLDFITKFLSAKEYAPTLKEIAKHFRLNSVSTVYQYIEALRVKGYLNKEENKSRSIAPVEQSYEEIPLFGYIAAGEPIQAISNPEPISVPKTMLSKTGLHYALRVKGNSMIEEGINDGDTVIIRRQETAENGQKVVALINGNEATLKKIYREKNGFRLQPANSSMKPIFTKSLTIQGKVIGILPNYEDRTKVRSSIITGQQKSKRVKFEFDRIITGDVLDVMTQIAENSVHLAITSPPYNVGKDYDKHNDKSRLGTRAMLDPDEKGFIDTPPVPLPLHLH